MHGIFYLLWKSLEYVLPLASVIYLPPRRRTVMGDPKKQKSLEVRVSNIVGHRDPPIDKGSDDRNTCSVHDQNGEALRVAASTNKIAFFLTCTTDVLQTS
jgi:hypothetical protein